MKTETNMKRVRVNPPRKFRIGHQGDLACPHRDLSCCDACAAEYPEIVDVVGAHYWLPTQEERDWHARMMAQARDDRCPSCGCSVHIDSYDAPPMPTGGCEDPEGCGWLRRELSAMESISG